MGLNERYTWELETVDGNVLSQINGDKWQNVKPQKVLRASIVPFDPVLPRCDVFCNDKNKFVRRFGKGFLKQEHDFELAEYVQCIETEQQRIWVKSSNGQMIVTHNQFNFKV